MLHDAGTVATYVVTTRDALRKLFIVLKMIDFVKIKRRRRYFEAAYITSEGILAQRHKLISPMQPQLKC